jgi:hypothetical protein
MPVRELVQHAKGNTCLRNDLLDPWPPNDLDPWHHAKEGNVYCLKVTHCRARIMDCEIQKVKVRHNSFLCVMPHTLMVDVSGISHSASPFAFAALGGRLPQCFNTELRRHPCGWPLGGRNVTHGLCNITHL